MIVVDEQLQDEQIVAAFGNWYPGRVAPITALRPGSVIKDDVIPHLLRRERQPTFITVNVSDFWGVTRPDQHCCIVTVNLPGSRAGDVSGMVRRLLRRPEFFSASARMGKVVRVSTRAVEYYGTDGLVHSLSWTDG